MREIKFRFWGPFGEWEEPDEMTQKMTMLYGDEFAWEEYEPINDLFSGLENTEPETIAMQYTGLKDKNGKEIYEGDILSVPGGFCGDYRERHKKVVTEWLAEDRGHEAGFWLDSPDGVGWKECEVIGNIYENPELLEKTNV